MQQRDSTTTGGVVDVRKGDCGLRGGCAAWDWVSVRPPPSQRRDEPSALRGVPGGQPAGLRGAVFDAGSDSPG